MRNLGKPLNSTEEACVTDEKWYIFQEINSIYGEVQPGEDSADGTIIYFGKYPNYEACQAAIETANFQSFTWVNKDDTTGYSTMCYGRTTGFWKATSQKNVVSGKKGNTKCERYFENCKVTIEWS